MSSLPLDEAVSTNQFPASVTSDELGTPTRLAEFTEDQTDRLRVARHKAGAGDVTLPWQILTDCDLEARYTLGSEGQFAHPDYGMIRARYVQFGLLTGVVLGGPVGMLIGQKNPWVVTNVFARSAPTLIVGLAGAYVNYAQGSFGWAITEGVNLHSLQVDPGVGVRAPVGWTADNRLGKSGGAVGLALTVSSGVVAPGDVIVKVSRDALSVPVDPTVDLTGVYDYMSQIEKRINKQFDTDQLEAYILQRLVAKLTADQALVQSTEVLQASANYSILARTAADESLRLANVTSVQLQATVTSQKLAKAWRDEAGYYAESSTTASNVATLSKNLADVSATAAFTSESNAKVSETNAGTSATSAYNYSVTAGTKAGEALSSATAAATSKASAESFSNSAQSYSQAAYGYMVTASQQSGDTKAYTDAKVSALTSAYTSADTAISNSLTNLSAIVKTPNNILVNSDIRLGTEYWASTGTSGEFQTGVNIAGDMWRPYGENVFGIYQNGESIVESYWYSEFTAVVASSWVEGSAWFAAHRATCRIVLYFYRENYEAIAAYSPGYQTVNTGGRTLANWTRLFAKCQVPADAALMRILLAKSPTQAGQGNSYMWSVRPQVAVVDQNTASPVPYTSSFANSQYIINVSTTVNGHTTTINQHTSSINGILGEYTIGITSDGKFAGFKLINGAYVQSTLQIDVDKFIVGGSQIFYIEGGVTYIADARIKNATIDYAKIKNFATGFSVVRRGVELTGSGDTSVPGGGGGETLVPPREGGAIP